MKKRLRRRWISSDSDIDLLEHELEEESDINEDDIVIADDDPEVVGLREEFGESVTLDNLRSMRGEKMRDLRAQDREDRKLELK